MLTIRQTRLLSDMPPIIHCVRHAQGFHNEGGGNYHLSDPDLTLLGKQQCEALRKASFPDQYSISLVVASPLRRALHTAYLTFKPTLESQKERSPRIIAFPDAQEISDDPCDVGSNLDTLQDAISENSWPVDLSLVKTGWNDKGLDSRYSPQLKALRARARDTRIFLRNKIRELVRAGDADAQLVLVTHGCFLHFLTEDWDDAERANGTGWSNCETRSYIFETSAMSDDDTEASLVETIESRRRRGRLHALYSKERQAEMFGKAMDFWEASGLQRPDKVGFEDMKKM